MALTKAATTLMNGVTTSTTSSAVDVSNSYSTTVGIEVVQVGTATTAASWKLNVSLDGGTDYFVHAEASAGTAAGTYTWTVDLPMAATHVTLTSTAQSGGTSSTFDAEVGEVTALS
jgi:hypothetical protein